MSLFRALSFVVLLMLLWVTEVSAATYSLIPPNQRPAICSGTQGYWSGNVYVCDWGRPFSVASGDTITSNTNIRILSNNGFNLTNVTLGGSSYTIDLEAQGNNETRLTGSTLYGSIYGSSNNVRLQSGTVVQGVVNVTGSFQSTNATVGGNVSANSGITAVDSTFYANLTSSNSSINLTRGVVYNNVTVTAQTLTATGTIFNGNILSTSGNITLTDADVAGNVSAPSNAITATNTDITGTVTANGNISLTNVEVDGKVTSTANIVSGTGTVFGNGISGGSGILVSGGSITGDLRSSCNNIVLTSTTMTSGTIQTTPTLGSGCAANKVEFNNSTVNATILGGPNNVYVKDSQFTGDIKARFNVELENSKVYGNIVGEPGFILHTVDLDDSFVYGNVTVRNDYGKITGNWPDSAIYGNCSYDYVTPSLCSPAQPAAADAYWKFDEAQWTGASNQVLDSSVNLKHGRSRNGAATAVLDPSPASCTFGTFLRGSSSSNNPHVYVERNAYFHNADDFGFTLWLKMNASQQYGSRQVILAYGDEDGVEEEDEGRFELLRTSAGRLRFAVRMQSEALRYVEVTGTSIFDGQWKHIAVSYSKQNKRLRLYVNNVLVSDTPNASIGNGNNDRTPNDGDSGLSIGALPDGDYGIRGQIDEVKFFAHEPTAAEIQAMYQQTASCANECFNENFTSDTNWYLTQRNSTAPSLRTSPSRLRLTENIKNQSTSITFKRSFPAAGNKMTIEFDHYAYGGTGADGIALVLSDASITPVPGSYGGSLGYAQRTNVSPSQSGFAGGWLGIGFDEYGSFSQETEGRVGGTTARPNAIGVRAASSTSYGWLGGTTTLSPALSASGNSLARGDRYRITIDSTASSSTAVAFQLERRLAGGTTYSTLLTSSNLLALGQPVPPANLLLSYTGSTGDNTNFHEITNIQVCTQKPSTPIEFGNQVHHFELSYPAQGLTCESSTVTIKACADASCSTLYTGAATLTLNATNSASWVGGNQVTFSNGLATKYLSKTVSGDSVISVASSSVATSAAAVCKEGSSVDTACSMTFQNTGLRFSTVSNQVAGVQSPSKVKLQVVRTDTNTGACVARVIPASTVRFAYQCVNPTSCVVGQSFEINDSVQSTNGASCTTSSNFNAISANPASAVTQYTSLNRCFNSSSAETEFNIKYSDVGQVKLHAQLQLAASGNEPALSLSQESNAFVVRPYQINVTTALSSATANPANAANPQTSGTGNGFIAAGEAFQVYVSPVNAQGVITPNYGNETSPETVAVDFGQLLHPLGGVNGTLTPGAAFTKINSGTYSNRFHSTGFSWNEVGSFSLLARVGDNNYLASGAGAELTSVPYTVGRFFPKHYALASSAFENTCAAFSYMGQPAIKLAYELQARNVAGEITQNYGPGYGVLAVPSVVLENADNGTDLSGRASVPASSWVNGKYTFAQTNLSFNKLTTPDGPYSVLMAGVRVTDTLDGRDLDVKNMDPASVGACGSSCVAAAVSGALDLRFGRLKLIGGEVADVPVPSPLDPDPVINLPVELEAEYWNGQGFITNTDDDCTVVDSTQLLFSGTPFTEVKGSPASLIAGSSRLSPSQLPSIYFEVKLATPTGTWPVFYQAPNWLKFDWLKEPQGQPLVLENPSAEVSVGRFRGNKRQIFWQEKLN